MPATYFASSFGGVRMLVATIDTERGKDIAVQSPSTGNRHSLSARGGRLHRSTVEVLFLNQPGQAPYLERYRAFLDLAEREEPQVFVHPLDGSYRAQIGDIQTTGSSGESQIRVTCSVLRDDEPQTTFRVGAGISPVAGIDAVTDAAKATSDALLAAGFPAGAIAAPREDLIAFPLLGDSVDSVRTWGEAEDLDPQAVFLGVASLCDRIDQAMADYRLASDLALWPAYTSMVRLRYTVVRAGQALTADTERMFDLFVDRPRPLLAICAEVYGASLAQDYAARIAKANRLRTPGLVPAATTLKMLERR